LLDEAIELLTPRGEGVYLDGTVGAGGHAEAILEASSPGGRLIGIDRDPGAIEISRERLGRFGDRVEFHNLNFADLDELRTLAGAHLDGALLDLGVSSMQIDEMARGFSYRQDAQLDMRMGPSGEPARDMLARADLDTLTEILRDYGEERYARRIAREIVRARQREAVTTTGRLRAIVESAVPARSHPLKSVARVFQALRIAVNDELSALRTGLRLVVDRLSAGSRLVVISYHSLEDRIVKTTFREMASDCVCPRGLPVCGCDKIAEVIILTRKPVRPGDEEIATNPRSRSARLRAVERIAA
jgi:16S rRNA (cytosine1402-N4)-methyltransferase